jgi:hypothetical protein
MGNVMISGSNAAKFFHLLFTNQLVSKAVVQMMSQWAPFTNGFAADCKGKEDRTCMQYGLGVMRLPYVFRATSSCSTSPNDCICDKDGENCYVVIDLYGHLGEDWGSSMMLAGYLPQFNVSVGAGIGSQLGMNSTIDARSNMAAGNALQCPMLRAIARTLNPSFPLFEC